jgi:Zn-dependent peptidase ImmA (M78 family)/transcriptional regulator with XRE-family HTH domain
MRGYPGAMESIGDRIRGRLDASEVASQRELASLVGMTPDALSRALRGERGFSIVELQSISSVLAVSMHWIATGTPDPNELRIAARHGYDHAQQARIAVDWRAARAVLEDIAVAYEQVDRDLPVRIGPAVPRAAAQVRRLLVERSGEGFVRSFADAIEQTFAIDVIRASEISDGYSISIGRRTVVAVSDTSNWFRQNWSLAHELGHVALGTMSSIDAPTNDVDPAERAANAFAAELLLPARMMRGLDWRTITAADVATLLWSTGVSAKALASRLQTLRVDVGALEFELRNPSTQRYLHRHLDVPGQSTDEIVSRRMQDAGSRRFPIDLLTAHRDAIEEGRIHAGMLAWMLDDDAADIEAELAPGSDSGDDSAADLARLLGLEE